MSRLGIVMISAALLTAAGPSAARTVEGVEFKEQFKSGSVVMPLRGASLLRYRVLFRGYVAALYLDMDERALEDVPRRLEIEYFWAIPAQTFARVTRSGIERNVSGAGFTALRERIERFSRFYTDVQPGDRYALTYLPGVGTTLSLNGEELGRVEGADFAAALFSIWLGEAPFDEKLKLALLGEKI